VSLHYSKKARIRHRVFLSHAVAVGELIHSRLQRRLFFRALLGLSVVLVLLSLTFGAAPAQAHSLLIRSEPTDLSQLSTSPNVLRLFFSDEVDLSATTVELFDASNVRLTDVGELHQDQERGSEVGVVAVSAALPNLPIGVYQATWRTTSPDAHVTRGSVFFGVGPVTVTARPQPEGSFQPKESALRGIAVGGLFVLMGAALRAWLWRTNVDRSKRTFASVAGLTIAAVGIFAYGSTTHLVSSQPASFTAVIQQVHLLFSAVWAGGCIVVTAMWWRARRDPSRRTAVRGLAFTFARPASLALMVSVATGLILSSRTVTSVDALLQSNYGHILLVKLMFASVAMAFGLRNAAALGHKFATDSLRVLRIRQGRLFAGLTSETLAIIGTIAMAALLATTPAAAGARWQFEDRIDSAQPTTSVELADLVATLTIKPNRPGSNFIDLGVFDTRVPVPAAEKQVAVTLFRPQSTTPVVRQAVAMGDGYFRVVGDDLSVSGAWMIQIDVSRVGLTSESVTIPWTVADGLGAGSRPVLFSKRQIAPVLRVLAICVLMVGLLLYLRIRRRSGPWKEANPETPAPTALETTASLMPDGELAG
jgi:methionine-rich copper-binding protein CopC/putative copper export protein